MLARIRHTLRNIVNHYAGDNTPAIANSNHDKDIVKHASTRLLWAIGSISIMLIIWAAIARVDTVTRAEGRIAPSARLQIIQNLEGGIISEIFVKPGDTVAPGSKLVTLSPIQHQAELQSRLQQRLSLEAKIARLQAQIDGTPLTFNDNVKTQGADFMHIEEITYQSKKAEQASLLNVVESQRIQKIKEAEEADITRHTLQNTLALSQEERDIIAKLVERGLEPKLELVRIDRGLAEINGRAAAAKTQSERSRAAVAELTARRLATEKQFKSEALAELNRTQLEYKPLLAVIPSLEDRVKRTTLTNTLKKGIVNRVLISTIGGIVKPGEPIIEIVPNDDQLIVEALIRPNDIGFIKIGQPAKVKITAYDFSIFGGMDGVVKSISADAVPNEKGEAFYQVRIETRTTALEVLDKKLPVIPGMQAQVDIVTGDKTVLQFLSKPLMAVKENAFRER